MKKVLHLLENIQSRLPPLDPATAAAGGDAGAAAATTEADP